MQAFCVPGTYLGIISWPRVPVPSKPLFPSLNPSMDQLPPHPGSDILCFKVAKGFSLVSASAIKGSAWKHKVVVALVRSSFRLLLVPELMVKLQVSETSLPLHHFPGSSFALTYW